MRFPFTFFTQEAFSIYIQHSSKPAGILAIHISNTYLDLRPVILAAADHFGVNVIWVHSLGDGVISSECDWMLRSRGELPRNGRDAVIAGQKELSLPAIRPWTDDYSNLLQILKR